MDITPLSGTCMPRHRHQEWTEFMKILDEETPAERQAPKSFVWTAKAGDILEKVKQAPATLDKRLTG